MLNNNITLNDIFNIKSISLISILVFLHFIPYFSYCTHIIHEFGHIFAIKKTYKQTSFKKSLSITIEQKKYKYITHSKYYKFLCLYKTQHVKIIRKNAIMGYVFEVIAIIINIIIFSQILNNFERLLFYLIYLLMFILVCLIPLIKSSDRKYYKNPLIYSYKRPTNNSKIIPLKKIIIKLLILLFFSHIISQLTIIYFDNIITIITSIFKNIIIQ